MNVLINLQHYFLYAANKIAWNNLFFFKKTLNVTHNISVYFCSFGNQLQFAQETWKKIAVLLKL